MNRKLLVFIRHLSLTGLFAILFIFSSVTNGTSQQGDNGSIKSLEYQNGYDEGYRDATDGIESLCAHSKCKAQDPYERGYKLGYKKGIRELKKRDIRPLIDSPGKTIGSDFNGDGIHDFIVGASRNDDGGPNQTGAAYIFFGSTTLSGTKDLGGAESADVTLLGKAGANYLGRGVASAGDVNGDGIDDILVGAFKNDDGVGSEAGAAYIIFGATDLSGTKDMGDADEDFRILGKATNNFLGFDVSGVGDVNGDGFDDIIVGAHYNYEGASRAGAAYVFFGSATLSGTKSLGGAQSADITVLGAATNDYLGKNVSGLGDVNGDGFDDFIVGAYQNNDGSGADTGAAYVFFGSTTLSGTFDMGGGVQSAAVTLFGVTYNDEFGKSVSGAGDVNGDGFDDILVGADLNNDGGSNNEGAAYIFFGASNLSGTKNLGTGESADVTFLGKETTDLLGYSVSGVGDINDDGFADILVGAKGNNDGGATDEGAAYVFFGASNLSGTKSLGGVDSADVTFLGNQTTSRLGNSVSGVGDVDGNGIPDLIVGARYNDDGVAGANTGAAFIFFGSTTLSGTIDVGTAGSSADVTILGKAGTDRLGIRVGGGRSNPGS